MPKSHIVYLIGPPCSGKTTYVKNNYVGYTVLSSDDIIEKLAIKNNILKNGYPDYDRAYSLYIKDAEKEFFSLFRNSIINNENIVIDRTNVSNKSRSRTLSMISKKKYDITFVFFNVSLLKILYRNLFRKNKYISFKKLIDFYFGIELSNDQNIEMIYVNKKYSKFRLWLNKCYKKNYRNIFKNIASIFVKDNNKNVNSTEKKQ